MYENGCNPMPSQCLLCAIEEVMGKRYVEDICIEYDNNRLTCALTSVENSSNYENTILAHNHRNTSPPNRSYIPAK